MTDATSPTPDVLDAAGDDLPTEPVPAPTDDEAVRSLAYEFYVARGRVDGDDVADWLAAEQALAARRSAPADELGEPPAEHEW